MAGNAVIFSVSGFFFLGIVFGPLAISNARKAEALHHSATLGKVLGWIYTIAGVLSLLVFLFIHRCGIRLGQLADHKAWIHQVPWNFLLPAAIPHNFYAYPVCISLD